ncbi:MAG TPA: hypothetical protein PKK06_16205 [Phycisphaerae bacterium]|nr:hypothetical protein [Phycisphaerae bacterium]HNU46219.1 hypothetical protein [Phycisphaerae bacterium]
MAQERPNPIREWLTVARAHAPIWREHLGTWGRAVRENPRLLWETPAARYGLYAVAAVLLLWVGSAVANRLATPVDPETRVAAATFDYHVICTNPECGQHFILRRPKSFSDFPVRCPKCEQRTGMRALPCNSATCRGKWVVPQVQGSEQRCPQCGALLKP